MVAVARVIQGISQVPTRMTAPRKPKAMPAVVATLSTVTESPRASPVTTVRMTRPSMSSRTAAPRMICPSTIP